MPSLHSSVDLLFQELKTSADGLTSQEAAARLKQYGPNSFEQARSMSDVEAFLRQFLNPLVLVLLISAGLSYFLGEMRGGIIISVLVLFSVCLQFYHERRAHSDREKSVCESGILNRGVFPGGKAGGRK